MNFRAGFKRLFNVIIILAGVYFGFGLMLSYSYEPIISLVTWFFIGMAVTYVVLKPIEMMFFYIWDGFLQNKKEVN